MTQALKRVRFIGFFGRTCAGKEEATKLLVRKLSNVAVFSFGQLLRDSREPNHPLHLVVKQCREEADEGFLSRDEIKQPVIEQAIRALYESGIETVIGDGIPRSGTQTPLVLDFLDRLRADGYDVRDQYIYFFLPPEISEARIDKRRQDFLARFGEIRPDDEPHKVAVRRKEFEEKTWDGVRQIAALGKLHIIDARKRLEKVHEQIWVELARPEPRPIDRAFLELRGWIHEEFAREDGKILNSERFISNESRMERR